MPSKRDRHSDAIRDIAAADSFPASDPPATTGEKGTRAVPADELMQEPSSPPEGAVPLSRRFADLEAAKLALEKLVRDGPFDGSLATLDQRQDGVELRLSAPPADAERLRTLLLRA